MKKSLTALVVCALLVVLFGQTAWAAPPAGTSTGTQIVHIVRWGENLWRISRWYGTTVEAIAYANGIVNPHRIYAGDRLVIPGAYPHHGGHPRPYPSPHPGPYYPPHHTGFYYTVRWGDTLSGIAWRHRVNMWSIVHANGIANPNIIYAGQRLYIP
jgi:LysM repeat protein